MRDYRKKRPIFCKMNNGVLIKEVHKLFIQILYKETLYSNFNRRWAKSQSTLLKNYLVWKNKAQKISQTVQSVSSSALSWLKLSAPVAKLISPLTDTA